MPGFVTDLSWNFCGWNRGDTIFWHSNGKGQSHEWRCPSSFYDWT